MMRVPISPFCLLGLLLLATLGACTERTAAGSDLYDEQVGEADRYGGTVVLGIAADVTDTNPLTYFFTSSAYMQQHLLFMSLVVLIGTSSAIWCW